MADIDAILSTLIDEPDGRSRIMSRARVPIGLGDERPLTPDDFAVLANSSGYTDGAPEIKRLRATHHRLAQLLAAGNDYQTCSLLTGYDPGRISVLSSDPTFSDLVAFYQAESRQQNLDVVSVLLDTAVDALSEFRERLHETPEAIAPKDLLSAAKLGLDRSGFGPSSTSLNVTATLSDERLAQLHAKARANSRAEVIIGTAHKIEDAPLSESPHEARSHSEADAARLLAGGTSEPRQE